MMFKIMMVETIHKTCMPTPDQSWAVVIVPTKVSMGKKNVI